MTASLPDEVQAVFDRFITTELTTVNRAGQPITWPVTPYYSLGRPVHRRHDRPGLSQEGQRRSRQSARLAAVLRPDRLGPARPSDGPDPGHRRRRRSRSGGQPPAIRARVDREASRHREPASARPAQADAGLVLHADLHPRPSRARVRVATRGHRGRAQAVRRPHGGGSLRPLRGARPLPRRPGRRRQRLGRSPERARLAVPNRGPVARVARRVPVRGAGAREHRCGRPLDPDRG